MKNLESLKSMIGNTPMLEIIFKYNGDIRRIYAKAEYYNISGSIKDRMAYYILSKAIEDNKLPEDATVIEATSGNTGIAFAALSKAIGRNVVIFMPTWMSEERKSLLKSFGAEIILVSKEEGGFTGSIQKSKEYAKKTPHSFLPLQFENEYNSLSHYYTTAKEIVSQLEDLGLTADIFTAGVGTGGTIMGIGRYLKEIKPKTKVHPLEPLSCPSLSTNGKVIGDHRIQGIGDEFVPAIVDFSKLDEIVQVDDGDAIIMAQKLSSELGIGVGISSGANFIGAVLSQNKLGENSVSVTVFADDNKKYLSTDLMKKEPVKEGFISSNIELLEAHSIDKVCSVCPYYVKQKIK